MPANGDEREETAAEQHGFFGDERRALKLVSDSFGVLQVGKSRRRVGGHAEIPSWPGPGVRESSGRLAVAALLRPAM